MSLSLECKKAKANRIYPRIFMRRHFGGGCTDCQYGSPFRNVCRTAKFPDANSNGSKLANDGDA